jgi:hypothetical protein
MKNYKILSALGLYSAFLFIGHHGPLSAHAHGHETHPLVIVAQPSTHDLNLPDTTVTVASAHDEPQVLGASTAVQPILFYNPVENIYEPSPSNLDEEQTKELYICISKQESADIKKFEKCYENIYTRAVLQDHSHTHKKHSVKLISKNEHAGRLMKMRKYQPHTV